MWTLLAELTDWLKSAIAFLINLLPDSPFTAINHSVISEYLPYLNWFIPFNQILAILQLWLVAVGVFYIYKVILKWIKML
jgi:hypothetical protein